MEQLLVQRLRVPVLLGLVQSTQDALGLQLQPGLVVLIEQLAGLQVVDELPDDVEVGVDDLPLQGDEGELLALLPQIPQPLVHAVDHVVGEEPFELPLLPLQGLLVPPLQLGSLPRQGDFVHGLLEVDDLGLHDLRTEALVRLLLPVQLLADQLTLDHPHVVGEELLVHVALLGRS